MSFTKEPIGQKAIRLLNAAFRINEPFNLDKPASYLWAISVFTLEKLIELAIAEEREACAELAAPERFVYGDYEWRVRCEVRDAIHERAAPKDEVSKDA